MENLNKIENKFEQTLGKTWEEELARLILMPGKSIKDQECPLLQLMEKSFMERVLWLEDQSKEQLDTIIKRCSKCGKCG
jgi:hypothetical protein